MATATPYTSSRPPHPSGEHPVLPARIRSSKRAFHWLRITGCDWAYAREMLLPMSIGLIVLVLVLAGNFVF